MAFTFAFTVVMQLCFLLLLLLLEFPLCVRFLVGWLLSVIHLQIDLFSCRFVVLLIGLINLFTSVCASFFAILSLV